jgi:hypothetical protein
MFTVDLLFSPHAGTKKIPYASAVSTQPAALSPALAHKVEAYSPFYAWGKPAAGLRAFGSLHRIEQSRTAKEVMEQHFARAPQDLLSSNSPDKDIERLKRSAARIRLRKLLETRLRETTSKTRSR